MWVIIPYYAASSRFFILLNIDEREDHRDGP
jgi:hypothetical protein